MDGNIEGKSEKMSAVIEELRLNNFEGYKKEEIRFTDGLNLIKGRNSTGKSSLLDALLFALYGEIPGVHKKLLVSRLPGIGELVVYIRFRNPANNSIIEVSRLGKLDKSGNFQTSELMLSVDKKEIEVESDEDLRRKVTENINASLRKFANIIYVRQGRLQDILEPRREDMDPIIRLTVLKELKEQVDETRKAFEKHEGRDVQTDLENIRTLIIPQLQKSIEELENDIPNLQADMKRLRDMINKAESPELLKLLKEVKARGELEEDLRNLKNTFQNYLSQADVDSWDALRKQIEKMKEEYGEMEEQLNNLEKEVRKLQETWSSNRGKASAIQDEIDKHEKLLREEFIVCPTCGQDLKAEKLLGILESNKNKLQSLRSKEKEQKIDYEKQNENYKKLNEKITLHTKAIENLGTIDDRLKDCVIKKKRIEDELLEYEKLIDKNLKILGLPLEVKDPELKVKVAQRLPLEPDQLYDKKKELRRKEDDLNRKIEKSDETKEKLNANKIKIAQLEERLKAADLGRQLYETLERAIETRRRDVLRKVEIRALSYYKRMTDQHDYDSIKIDPETYIVNVHPKNLTEYIPAKRDGGGHQTLIALAVRFALLEELGFRNLLVLDEPTYGVDSENLPQLADYLGEASRMVSQTILVTHHDICEEEASNIIEVSKNENGASYIKTKF